MPDKKYLGEIGSSDLAEKLQRQYHSADDSLLVFARPSGRGHKLTFIEKSPEELFWVQTPYKWYKVING